MSNILLALVMSWMVAITGYQTPAQLPKVQFEPHSFFVEKVCGGVECPSTGWYNDAGIIYLDQSFQTILSENSYPAKPDEAHARVVSILGGEIVHYLQDLSGKYTVKSCENFLSRDVSIRLWRRSNGRGKVFPKRIKA